MLVVAVAVFVYVIIMYRITQPFNGLWSGTNRVGRYQKKHIHPLTPILIIRDPSSTSSIYYDPQHPPYSIYVLSVVVVQNNSLQNCCLKTTTNCFLSFAVFWIFRDVETESNLSSAEFDNSLSLLGLTPISSATQRPTNVDASKLSHDLISHLPSMRATYLEIVPVSSSTHFESWSVFCADFFSVVFSGFPRLLVSPGVVSVKFPWPQISWLRVGTLCSVVLSGRRTLQSLFLCWCCLWCCDAVDCITHKISVILQSSLFWG